VGIIIIIIIIIIIKEMPYLNVNILRVFEHRSLRRIFGPERQAGVTWIKLYNEKPLCPIILG